MHAIRTPYKVKNTWLLWTRVQSYAKNQNIHFVFNFCCFWHQNGQKNAFSAYLATPKMPDTMLVGIPFVPKIPSDWS